MVSATERRRQLVTGVIGTALILVMGAVLLFGFRLATGMRASIAALQSASTLQAYPEEISQQLNALRDRLEVRAYSGQALSELQNTVRHFDAQLGQLEGASATDAPQVARLRSLWRQYQPVLEPVITFNGQPYVDSDTGSSLSREGRQHYAEVKRAQLFASENAHPLQALLAGLATSLQHNASNAATALRAMLLAGVLAALILAVAAGYLQLTRTRSERTAREAQEQTRYILQSVREGFFLLDANHCIGSVWSDALTQMFARKDFAGLPFEDLLRDLVPAVTLTTATKYIKLLWGDRAHENLMKSINPLGQLEITRENGQGGKEPRFLQFDFHRVTGPAGDITHVLCSVSDITASVLLARELQDSQDNANAQLEMMLRMLHIDPLQLSSFLDTTETSIKLVNTILREPARNDAEFRKKLTGLFRELHSVKGEASALNLSSIASRVHAMEDLVSECKKKPELSGNDFLPLVLKLDELLAHLRSVREMQARLATLKEVAPSGTHTVEGVPAEVRSAPLKAPAPGSGTTSLGELTPTLQSMAVRLAQDHKKQFQLAISGLDGVPETYAATIKDCLIQMLRNAAVHGIESPDVRRTLTKASSGTVRVDFRKITGGYELVFEDDGAGITPQSLKAAAVRKQLVTEAAAERMDTRAAMALIFAPGFSTQEGVSMDAGRGVGMDVVARSVAGLGGKIGVSTHPGKYTRFRVVLPDIDPDSVAVA
jgi:signal transduction histidine kinase